MITLEKNSNAFNRCKNELIWDKNVCYRFPVDCERFQMLFPQINRFPNVDLFLQAF